MLGKSEMLKKGLLSTAAVALVGGGLMAAPKDAEAVAFAYSALEVTAMNLTVLDSGGSSLGNITALGGFTSFNFDLNPLFVNLGATTAFTGFVGSTSGGASLDQSQLCLLSCAGFTNNDWTSPGGGGTAVANVPGGTTSFAVADSHMLNTVLTTLGGNPGATFGVQAGARSEGGGLLASGSQINGNLMNWNFATGAGDAGKRITLDWVEDRLLEVSTTDAGESASAGLQFTIELENVTDGTSETLFDLSPDGVLTDANDPPETQTGLSNTGFGVTTDAGTGGLLANKNYNLVFRIGSNATAESPLPEPGALGFLGVSLLGLGALRYRRRQQAAK